MAREDTQVAACLGDLPVELLYYLFSSCEPFVPRATYLSFSLVCRNWTHPAQTTLFRDVTIGNYPNRDFNSARLWLDSPARLRHPPRSVVVAATLASTEDEMEVFLALDGAAKLELWPDPCSCTPLEWFQSSTLSTLRRLVIGAPNSLEGATALLPSFRLETLVLVLSDMSISLPALETLLQPGALHSLQLVCISGSPGKNIILENLPRLAPNLRRLAFTYDQEGIGQLYITLLRKLPHLTVLCLPTMYEENFRTFIRAFDALPSGTKLEQVSLEWSGSIYTPGRPERIPFWNTMLQIMSHSTMSGLRQLDVRDYVDWGALDGTKEWHSLLDLCQERGAKVVSCRYPEHGAAECCCDWAYG
ncbi:hypothetical protein T439DRAFT_325548 [Meredithblackwellia eburnea MCA 4105]